MRKQFVKIIEHQAYGFVKDCEDTSDRLPEKSVSEFPQYIVKNNEITTIRDDFNIRETCFFQQVVTTESSEPPEISRYCMLSPNKRKSDKYKPPRFHNPMQFLATTARISNMLEDLSADNCIKTAVLERQKMYICYGRDTVILVYIHRNIAGFFKGAFSCLSPCSCAHIQNATVFLIMLFNEVYCAFLNTDMLIRNVYHCYYEYYIYEYLKAIAIAKRKNRKIEQVRKGTFFSIYTEFSYTNTLPN